MEQSTVHRRVKFECQGMPGLKLGCKIFSLPLLHIVAVRSALCDWNFSAKCTQSYAVLPRPAPSCAVLRRKQEAVVKVDGSTDTREFSAVREALAQATAGALVLVGVDAARLLGSFRFNVIRTFASHLPVNRLKTDAFAHSYA